MWLPGTWFPGSVLQCGNPCVLCTLEVQGGSLLAAGGTPRECWSFTDKQGGQGIQAASRKGCRRLSLPQRLSLLQSETSQSLFVTSSSGVQSVHSRNPKWRKSSSQKSQSPSQSRGWRPSPLQSCPTWESPLGFHILPLECWPGNPSHPNHDSESGSPTPWALKPGECIHLEIGAGNGAKGKKYFHPVLWSARSWN